MLRMKHQGMLAGLVVALLAMPALPARADQDINKTVDARSNGVVTIENIAGSIEVIGWDRDEVKVEGTLTGDVEKVKIDGGKKVRIEVKYPRKMKNFKGGADLVIHVPSGSRLDVECISASIDVSGVTGAVGAESISGDVMVTGDCEQVEAESISGNVTVDGGGRELSIASISGRVKARGKVCAVEAETISGEIVLSFDKFLDLDVESVAGDATVSGDLDDNGEFEFEMHSGTLELTLPADVDADFRVETFSGEIDNEFGQKSRRTSKYSPGRELKFTNGDGSARVRIDTFSGDVIIRKN